MIVSWPDIAGIRPWLIELPDIAVDALYAKAASSIAGKHKVTSPVQAMDMLTWIYERDGGCTSTRCEAR